MNVNISWFNILVLKLYSNKNGSMTKLYNTLIMLKIKFTIRVIDRGDYTLRVHCIRFCMLETL